MELRKDWYDVVLFKSRNNAMVHMTYAQQLDSLSKCFDSFDKDSTVKTKFGRIYGANKANAAGASISDIQRSGSWQQDALNGSYLSRSLPLESMRTLAGFGPERN